MNNRTYVLIWLGQGISLDSDGVHRKETALEGKVTARHVQKVVNETAEREVEEIIRKPLRQPTNQTVDPEFLNAFEAFALAVKEARRSEWACAKINVVQDCVDALQKY